MNLFPFLTPSDTPAGRKAPRRGAQLGVEALETRTLMTCNVISGFVYHDANNNGLYERHLGESPIANSAIELRTAAGQVVGRTTTNADGYYEFDADQTISTAPAVQTHTVSFPSTLTNFDLTRSLPQFDPALGTLQAVEIIHTGSVTSDVRVENTSTSSAATISGNVSGVLTLTGPSFSLQVRPSRNTGSFTAARYDGTTDFSGASGHAFPARTAAASTSTRLTGAAVNAYIGTGSVQVREDARATSGASGGGNVHVAITSRAAATVTVKYHYIPNNCLRPGDYVIVQTNQPTGYLDGKEARNGVVLGNPIGTSIIPVTLNGADLVNNNFGELLPARLSGYVFKDMSAGGWNNGIKEPGEGGIDGVLLTLNYTDDTGSHTRTAVTDVNGFYQFGGLRPGTYEIVESQPTGWVDGLDAIGSQGGKSVNDRHFDIQLHAGQDGVNNNFGELLVSSLSGYVYWDTSPKGYNDGIKQADEAGIGGATVIVRGETVAGRFERTLMTNASGYYEVRDLAPGVYELIEVQPAGAVDGRDTVGSLGGHTVNDRFHSITVPAGVNGVNYNFGELKPVISADVSPPPPPAGATAEQVFAPTPATFPGPNDVNVVGKVSLFSASGVNATDPELRAQIAYVDGLYRTLFGYPADESGLVYWVRQLRATGSRDGLVQQLWAAAPHRAVQTQMLFRTYLGREASASDIAWWQGQFAAGLTETDAAVMILTSPEYSARFGDNAAFINALYQQVLGRSHDGAAMGYWNEVIARGGRAAAARAILNSDEARARLIHADYANYLGRAATDAERDYWLGQMRAGLSPQGFCQTILASAAFWGRARAAVGV